MRTDLRFVLKHVTSCAETVNAVNYFYKPRPRTDEYYYKEDCYVVNEPTGVFRADRGFTPNTEGSNQENWHQGIGNKGRNYGNYNR